MRTSECIVELASALAAAQGSLENAQKDGKSHHGKYPTLTSVFDAMRQPFSQNGLSIIQGASFQDSKVVITTRILHKSGQWIESDLPIKPNKEDAHSIGSAITYARRYAASPMLGIVSEEDDDGKEAMRSKTLDEENQALHKAIQQQEMIIEKLKSELFELKKPRFHYYDKACREWFDKAFLELNLAEDSRENAKEEILAQIEGLARDAKFIPFFQAVAKKVMGVES
jgi:hypothetical protein